MNHATTWNQSRLIQLRLLLCMYALEISTVAAIFALYRMASKGGWNEFLGSLIGAVWLACLLGAGLSVFVMLYLAHRYAAGNISPSF
jgi:hypothetical protein